MNPEQAQKLKSKYLSTFKLLKKKSMPIKYARVGEQRVEFFRIDDLQQTVENNKEAFKSLLNTPQPLDLIRQEAFWYLSRPLNAKKLKYPPVLEPTNQASQFGSFKFSTEESKRWLMILTVVAILFVVLFPIWPYELKYYVWYTSLILLVFSVGLLVVRLLLYSILSLFGYSFWLFPNLLTESSFIESWKPLHSFERWEKSTFTIVLRLIILGVFVYYGYEIYRDPSFVFENFSKTQEAVRDIHDWGVSKIKNEKNFTQRALTGSLQKILNETSDDGEGNKSSKNQTLETSEEQKARESAHQKQQKGQL